MNSKTASNLLPYPVIVLAASGDVDAINAVLKHYEGYIAALSTKQLYDASGTPHLCVDEALRRRLETKLITKILTFKVAYSFCPCGKRGPLSTFPVYGLFMLSIGKAHREPVSFYGLTTAFVL